MTILSHKLRVPTKVAVVELLLTRAREFELKFAIGTDEVARLVNHPLLVAANGNGPERLNATYFDTPERRLWSKGISLRVRDTNGRKKQTLKQVGSSVIDRGEWETETDDAVPSLAWIATTPLHRAFRHRVGDNLAPSFTVDVERTTYRLKQGTAEIEAAIDRGEIQGSGRRLPVREFELELKRGEPEDLFRLARQLVADVSLTPSLISKAERGYRLLDGSWGHPTKGPAAVLDPKMPSAEAFQAIAEACIHEMMLNLEAFTASDDIEAVHRSRVSLRRLRAATTLFKPLLDDDAFAALHDDLKWMSDLLGSARDLDVLQTEVLDPAAKGGAVPGGEDLARHMRARQRDAHVALAEGLASRRWRTALIDLIAWMANGSWIERGAAAEPFADFVRARLRKRLRRLIDRGAHLDHLEPAERHKVRIEAKKLRYMLEFVEAIPALGGKARCFRAVQGGLETLQSALGKLQDDEARRELLRHEISVGLAGAAQDSADIAAEVITNAAPDVDHLMAQATKALRKVKRNNPF